MSNSCVFIPVAPNGEPSQLFKDLAAHTDRETAKKAWAFTQTDLFKSEFSDMVRDKNGEITYENLAKILNLNSLMSTSKQDMNRAQDNNLISRTGESVEYDRGDVLLGKVSEYNKNSRSKVAVVTRNSSGKFTAEIKDKNPLSVAEADRNEARRNLNKALISIVEKAGFNVEFVDDPSYNGLFDPLIAEQTANNLKTVIRIANNERGLEALPEEVAHFVLAGLKDDVLKQRIDAVFTDGVVKQILGDQYDEYVKAYKDGRMPVDDRLREEAEGKALAALLKGQPVSTQINKSRNLFQRLWDKAKSLFAKIKESDIDNALINAENSLKPVANMIQSGEIDTVLSTEQIQKHEKLYDLANQADKLAEIAQDGETLLSKQLYILQNTQNGIDTKVLNTKIRAIRNAISNQQYSAACYNVLSQIGKDIKGLMNEAAHMGHIYNNTTDLNLISAESGLISRMSTSVQAYTKYLTALSQLPILIQRGQIQMDTAWASQISSLAKDYLDNLNTIKEDIGQMRFAVLKQLVSLYYGNLGAKPENFIETDKVKWESVDMILSRAKKDISWWDSNLFSAGDSRNPLLNVIHNIVTSQQAKRNNKINRFCMKMQEAEAKLHRAGYDNKFVYQYDAEGKPTGYYVGPVDFVRFERERQAYIDTLNPEVLDYYEIQKSIDKWDELHTEEVPVGKPINAKGDRRTEKMPKQSIYGVGDFQSGWSQEQKEYYNTLLEMKADMDAVLPIGMQHLYQAPQVRKSVSQMFDKDGRGAIGTLWQKWKNEFSVVEDNDEYGEDAMSKKKQNVLLDFSGKPIKRVPTYFTRLLDDMRDLSTDATHSMFSYISMSVNFSEMGQLANAMRLMQEHVSSENFEVVQTNGSKVITDMFRALNRTYEREYVKTGEGTNLVKAINEYIDRQFFNETKEVIGDVAITEKHSIKMDTLFNLFMRLTSVGRMGFNVLSGITNVTQGESQIMCEAMANRFFNMKDYGWSKKEYSKLLFDYMGNFNSSDRHDKMYMLINQFNSGEDFFRDMKDKDFNKSAFKRVMGRGNVYFLNSMGEHYLHTSGMLAVLQHEKVRRLSDPSKEVSLYDVITQVHDANGWHLELDSDIEFVDKNRSFLQSFGFTDKAIIKKSDRDKLFENLAVYINNINAGMHGGYSEAEKGNANRQALWRAILQFRQWMFGMYNKMYSRPYYDAAAGTMKEGSYYSMYKFVLGTLQDLKNMSIKEAIENNKLTVEEKKNARVAAAQSLLFVALTCICALTKGWKDKDERALRLLAYQMRRLEMETGALVPFPPTFIKNVFTLIQSPAAGVKTLENLSQMFDFAHLAFWSEDAYIKSGRFKGWWKPFKAAWTSTPIYNVQRLVDMDDYNYMFNIFGN